ncbi:hypothetical protein [Mycetohabitans endofungorum]|uniref:hypothetical protein n=1 Tax=Mycetohabitans endofungorum TaxID=417203 RepID=UPI002B05489E|nr:hypothetical protein [Mycetohabitans endofungorum]
MAYKVAVMVGSIRADSWNKKLARVGRGGDRARPGHTLTAGCQIRANRAMQAFQCIGALE